MIDFISYASFKKELYIFHNTKLFSIVFTKPIYQEYQINWGSIDQSLKDSLVFVKKL